MLFLHGLLDGLAVAFVDYDLGPLLDLVHFLLLAGGHFLHFVDFRHDSFLLVPELLHF